MKAFSNRWTEEFTFLSQDQCLSTHRATPGKQTFLPYRFGKKKRRGNKKRETLVRAGPFSEMQLPSVLWAHRSFGQGWEQPQAPDTMRGSGRACSSPPRKKAGLFRGLSAHGVSCAWSLESSWRCVSYWRQLHIPPAECGGPAPTAGQPSSRHRRQGLCRGGGSASGGTCSWGRQHILIV